MEGKENPFFAIHSLSTVALLIIMSLITHLSFHNSVACFSHNFFMHNVRKQECRRKYRISLVFSVLFVAGGWGAIAQSVNAQNTGALSYDQTTGAVRIDNNSFNLQTGELSNESNIPLPDGFPEQVRDRVAIPTFSDRLAPNSIEIRPNVDYVRQSFSEILGDRQPGSSYDLQTDSLRFSTQFNLHSSEGNHAYGEGIQVTVRNANGEVLRQETAFVRGFAVTRGPNGEELPESATLSVDYGPTERVELRVLNIRQDGADPSESGIYFAKDGRFIVEDLQDGGDRDFNDGDYVKIFSGRGEATTLEARENITYETEVVEVPLAPELRQEERVEAAVVESLQEADEVLIAETRDYGQVEAPDTASRWLGHASGARAASGEQLVYSEYTNESQFRLGSDGVGITGQLKPLLDNPDVPPTLLSGNLNFNPFVGNNEAGFTGTVGVTQYLTRTHRTVRDAFGNEIVSASGRRLLEPAGLITNRRLVGYVPSLPSTQARGERVFSVDGVFNLPEDRAFAIAPPDAQKVGRGNAAYTSNVGGVLIEYATGEISFLPQWNGSGYAQESFELGAGEARRIIYALVPQQPGQALALGEQYAVRDEGNRYAIADGNFVIISADRQPQNFAQETTEVYAVEDTLADRNNAATNVFNGIQGVYAEQVGGELIPTVDVNVQSEADARVGNELFPINTVVGDSGQRAYSRTTRAAGFYLKGSLTAGIGNQEDTVTRSSATVDQAVDAVRTTRRLDTFATPLFQREEITIETVAVERNSGTAFFDINQNGELENARFESDLSPAQLVESREVGRSSTVVRGEEALVDSVMLESVAFFDADGEAVALDETISTRKDSYPNFSAMQGEVALGAVMNLGNTPWTTAANTLRAELFARDVVIGAGGNGAETGWRAEFAFHPFGEQMRDAYRYDESGAVVPIYQTERVRDTAGKVVRETLSDATGTEVEVDVNRFLLDEKGDRVAQKVGTGVARGPGIYISVEDVTDDDEGVLVAGGLQFSF